MRRASRKRPVPSVETTPAPQPKPAPAVPTAYAVLRATLPDGIGGAEELQLAMPADEFGAAAWQLWSITLYLARLRRHQVQPSSATLRSHLASDVVPFPTPTLGFPYAALHDSRPSLLLDLELGALDDTGWPTARLVVIEQDTAEYGFTRTHRFRTARAITRAAARWLADECALLTGAAQRAGDEQLRERASLAGRLADQAETIRARAQQDALHENAEAARAAARGGSEEEPQLPAMEEKSGELQTVTGRLVRTDEPSGPGGDEPTLLLHVELAAPADRVTWREDRPGVLVCTVRGAAAEQVRALPAGTALVVVGRARSVVYRFEGDVRRRMEIFDVASIGVDLAAAPAPAAAASAA
ncbi:hypothetical protein [Streptomyces sp. NRRL B-24484]|uniref:hypothetical protein n=1 Tax=Streptomyces sp. NRRL B-24484 TaxID=1463833 RepID=UPI0004C20945|nr:hypothetical protein [Streptomyces sp. NRRL B-24484]